MALNMKTLGTRALSALVFVIILLGCLLWNYWSFSIFFFCVAMFGLNEFYRLCEKLNARPYKLAGMFGGIITYLAFIDTPVLTGQYNMLGPFVFILPFFILLVALFS